MKEINRELETDIRTICTSFLFIIPIYTAHIQNNTQHMILFCIAMGISVANHSHSYHTNKIRRKLFKSIDCNFMLGLALYLLIKSLYKSLYNKYLIIITSINYSIYKQIGSENIEYYTEVQKQWHILFHITGITTMALSIF